MTGEEEEDLPYGENFHDEGEARAWAEAADRKRPWRSMIFDRFASAVLLSSVAAPSILELGSGPGFLAAHVLDRCPDLRHYTLLDFSEPMLAQSRRRLAGHAARTEFIRADFKSEAWPEQVGGPFDFIFSHQAVHELRHKRHAPRLYAQIRSLMSPGSVLLVCDHLPDIAPTPRHRALYMGIAEYFAVLEDAGLTDVELLWSGHDMALYRAGACYSIER